MSPRRRDSTSSSSDSVQPEENSVIEKIEDAGSVVVGALGFAASLAEPASEADSPGARRCKALCSRPHNSCLSRALQMAVRFLSLAIALLDVPAIVFGFLPYWKNAFAWAFHLTFLLGSLFVVMGTLCPRARCVRKYIGFAADFCWPVGFYLFWQTSCLLHAPFIYCRRAGRPYTFMCLGNKLNAAAFAASLVDLVLGLVARFV